MKIPVEKKDQQLIEEGAPRLAAGVDPGIIPERFLTGASRAALDRGRASPGESCSTLTTSGRGDSPVTLEATLREMFSELEKLQDSLVALRLKVVEEKSLKGDAAIADQLEDTILDVMGLLDESRNAARAAQKAVGDPVDLDGARRALETCQERFHRIEQHFAADLVSSGKLKDLASLGSERGGEWLPWSGAVKQGIEQCRQPLEGASKALAACWQEIADRGGT